MKSFRKLTAVVLAVLTAVSMLLMSSCSTPAVAMTVDGKEYSTGEYLANLYMSFMSAFYDGGLYQYASYGMDPWEQTFPYGEGEDAKELPLSEMLVQVTKDNIVRQKAVKNLMEKYGVTIPQEDLDSLKAEMATYKESEMLAYGFNKEHYTEMYIATQLEESNLFFALYDKGGKKEVADADIRDFFDNNYVAYKAITLSQMDSEGKALSDADKEANSKTLEGYLEQYKKSKDMDAVIAQYQEDTNPTTTTTTAATTTTTAATTTTTTAAETTTTTTTTAAESTTTTAPADEEVDEEEVEEETDPNLQLMETVNGDKLIVEAVQKVAENTAEIISYTDSNGKDYIALVLRLNTEEAGGENYFEDQRDTILSGIKGEEFKNEVQAEADSLEVVYNERAISMCDPRNFEKVMENN